MSVMICRATTFYVILVVKLRSQLFYIFMFCALISKWKQKKKPNNLNSNFAQINNTLSSSYLLKMLHKYFLIV